MWKNIIKRTYMSKNIVLVIIYFNSFSIQMLWQYNKVALISILILRYFHRKVAYGRAKYRLYSVKNENTSFARENECTWKISNLQIWKKYTSINLNFAVRTYATINERIARLLKLFSFAFRTNESV